MKPFRLCLAIYCAVIVACSSTATERPPQLVTVTVRVGSVLAPDTIQSGFVRLRVEEDGAGHILVVFRLSSARDEVGRTAFLAALDTSRMTPPPAVARGGPEVGDTAEVILRLEPGQYLLACVSRGDNGHRHAGLGEWVVIDAVGPETGSIGNDSITSLTMTDYSFLTTDAWPSGRHLLKVVNDGHEDHQLRIDRLEPGMSLKQWFEAEGDADVSTPVAGIARTGPGQEAYLPLSLSAGNYVLYCLVPVEASGVPHAMVGMVRAVVVQ